MGLCLAERVLGGVGWLNLRSDAWHGHGYGTLGTIDAPLRAEADNDLYLSGASVRSHHRRCRARRSATSTAGGGCAVDIRGDWSSVFSLAVVVHLSSPLRFLGATDVLRCATLDAHVLSCLQTESGQSPTPHTAGVECIYPWGLVKPEARPVAEDKIQVSRGTLRNSKPRQVGRRLGAWRACGLGVELPGSVTEAQARQTVCDVPQPFPLVRRGYPLVRGLTIQIIEEEEILGTT